MSADKDGRRLDHHYFKKWASGQKRLEKIIDVDVFDSLVSINLLRERDGAYQSQPGAILVRDRKGFLRLAGDSSDRSWPCSGHVIMYADTMTQSVRPFGGWPASSDQMTIMKEHGIVPQTIRRNRDLISVTQAVAKEKRIRKLSLVSTAKELVRKLQGQMQETVRD